MATVGDPRSGTDCCSAHAWQVAEDSMTDTGVCDSGPAARKHISFVVTRTHQPTTLHLVVVQCLSYGPATTLRL